MNKNSNEGLVGVERRFVGWGGGVGEVQMEWIKSEIKQSAQQGQRVVVFTHLGIREGSCPPACLMYNYKEVIAALTSVPGVCVATFSGHSHQNGYQEGDGMHSVVLNAVVETPPDRNSYGTLNFYEDRIELVGVDTMQSLTLDLI